MRRTRVAAVIQRSGEAFTRAGSTRTGVFWTMSFAQAARFAPAYVVDGYDRPIWGLLTRPEDALATDEIIGWRGDTYRVRSGIEMRVAGESLACQYVIEREAASP